MSQLNQLLRTDSFKPFVQKGFRAPSSKEHPVKFLDYERLPFGVFSVDYMLAGGIPFNVISQLFGPPSGGKNTASIILAKSLSQYCCGCLTPLSGCVCSEPTILKTFYCHIGEGRPDGYWSNILGYEADQHMFLATPEYGEQAGDAIEAAIESKDCGLIILDSLAGLDSRRSMQESYEKGLMAEAPRLISKLVKRVNGRLLLEYKKGHRIAAVFLNQIRSVIGGGPYGPSETTAGGWGSKHGYRLSIRCSQLAVEKKEIDSVSHLKDVLRFSMSVLGSEAKQQILLLAGKAEYKLSTTAEEDIDVGRPLDAKTTISYANQFGLIKKIGDRYLALDQSFKTIKDLAVFLQVDHQADALFKWQIVQEAKRLHTERLGLNRVRRINKCIGNAASVTAPPTIIKKGKLRVSLKKRTTSAE